MKVLKKIILSLLRSCNRKIFSTNWKDLRNVRPVSQLFGVDRGQPVDRYYIEKFLNENKKYIQGTVVEIGDDTYARKYGMNITRQEILHLTSDNPRATIIGDLTNQKTLKNQIADCFICTQTLNFIYDVKSAIEGIYFMLKDKGCALVTVSGISQISRYDMERWGDFWRFTDKSISGIFSEVFGSENIQLHTYGNVLSSVALLEGISAEELSEDELLFNDNVYQVIIAVKAIKK